MCLSIPLHMMQSFFHHEQGIILDTEKWLLDGVSISNHLHLQLIFISKLCVHPRYETQSILRCNVPWSWGSESLALRTCLIREPPHDQGTLYLRMLCGE